MPSTPWTPGPWYVTLNPFRVGHRGVLGTFRLIADCPPRTWECEGATHYAANPDDAVMAFEAQANARLIALAPELAGALGDVLAAFDCARSGRDYHSPKRIVAARALLARLHGEGSASQ